MCLIGWLLLGTFGWRYFGTMLTTGGESHLAFRTGAVEPKQAAWDHIAAHSGDGPMVVTADSWWLYWPLAYLAAGEPRARIGGDFPGAPSDSDGLRTTPELAGRFLRRGEFAARRTDRLTPRAGRHNRHYRLFRPSAARIAARSGPGRGCSERNV